MGVLQTQSLTLSYGDTNIIEDLSVQIPEGKITVLIGSNGCGKSTLLRSLARLMKPNQGSVLLDGRDIHQSATKEVARKMAILPQGPVAPEGLTVHQLVKQGRYPYQTWLKQWSEEDEKLVSYALKVTNMEPFADRSVDALSGGQRQRAWIAMTLAQNTDIILLDEPTTYLDMSHQIEILDLLYELNRKEGRTIAMVLHDLNLACRYADHIIAVRDKGIYNQGAPESILTPQLVKDVFHMECVICSDPLFGTPMCVPRGKGRMCPANCELLEQCDAPQLVGAV
ncbi:ABC transporter ATP-binding protein [Paenibacillus sp. ACRRX]|uniref:ABC transporter ATP-binding protein n=1 Tax=unclassified Paenibacillus TaxID=185978 RepID=UPI001EF70CC5|nr:MULTISPECIES: ABC transporter ATP-binding protein [unclassified Paenibacillus]MCG7408071.1 ABC transporter ATP-binding protein [Paenibacillus sp. ACRRX]MDK8181546.1 ABC transporter ATP-binding protein [Paenibacillus sp. UMB4589-SE434]